VDGNTTTVIFRKWPAAGGGGVIALFPYVPGTRNPATCMSFEHVGQHGSADLAWVMTDTRPASPAEYAALKRELESAPYSYTLAVCDRIPPDAFTVRNAHA
jgi:hypothetical protein